MIKLRGITEMIINLDELDNSDNLKDGHPSNALFTYRVTDRTLVSNIGRAIIKKLAVKFEGMRY